MQIRRLVMTLGLLLSAFFVFAAPVHAKTLNWHRWDSEIHINQDGSFSVRETYEIEFIGGDFTFGYRKIPIKNFLSLENVSVSGDGQPYQNSSDHGANTFEWGKDGNEYVVNWNYSPTSDSLHTFVIEYRVIGGLYIDAAKGDGLSWNAVGPDHDFDIESSIVSIYVPAGTRFDSQQAPILSGAGATKYVFGQDMQSLTVNANSIPAGQAFAVGIRFPHGYVTAKRPPWQAAEERRPLLNLIVGGVGILVLVVGGLGIYSLWVFAGKDPDIGPVPSQLTEPPSAMPPGLAGTLVDEKADLQDIIATLVDLAQRGAIDMEEQKKTSFGLIESTTFVFHRRSDFKGQLRSYESLLISEMFGSSEQIALKELQNSFYTAVPRLQQALYSEVVKEGLFPASPQSVRARYMGLGIVGMIVAAGLFFCLGPVLGEQIDTFFCPFGAIGLASLGLVVISGAMPTKTRKGAEEAAKWRAFREYLLHIDRFVDLKQVADQFERFLPYSIAFGLERTWITKFSRITTTPVPGWYYPVGMPYGHHYGRMEGSSSSMLGGEASGTRIEDLSGRAVGSAPSLTGMSDRAFTGLNSISAGLFTMLNSTASTFTSVPRSSGSHSGGGWSGGGGGFSAGGGGGAGFG